jgi:uncharacterized protein (DUF58 family)
MDRPVPTMRAVWLFALGLLPSLGAVSVPAAAPLVLGLDVLVLFLVALDFFLAPRPRSITVRRELLPILSSGVPNRVRFHLEVRRGQARVIRGELRDAVAPGPAVQGLRQRFELERERHLEGWITPATRGDLQLLGVWLRLDGPLGLCCRQRHVGLEATVKVYPDLSALSKDAMKLASSKATEGRRVVPVRSEGREFESLREYRDGDDRRSVDWKATARRARTMVRVHQPERDQRVLLLLDCGRHMAGEVARRRKLDHAVDAALRLAKVSLGLGDSVGVVAFGAQVRSSLVPRKGAEQLRAIAHALYRLDATLEESDFGAALDVAFARAHRRALVVIMTDLLDPKSALALIGRTRRLVPRHLPLIASLLDDDVHRAAMEVPRSAEDAYRRLVASRLEAEARATIAYLRNAGAQVVRASPAGFGAASVAAYLGIKHRGLL